MYASLNWLREICRFEADAAEVAATLTARGLTVDSIQEIDDDVRLEIDVPANRPDCLGHRGLARELSAAYSLPLCETAGAPEGDGPAVEKSIAVRIEAPDLCGRYTAKIVRHVEVRPSPPWVVQRLDACGLRTINNVVDVSNLVMLETGNPIHFFDLPTVGGAQIVIRRALPGETLTTLDGERRCLDEEMLVIADGDRGVALAGVMGGAATEIGDSTTDVLIESAWFAANSIRRTSRRVGLSTDASHRFERGVDPEGVVVAQALAVRLLVELAAGRPDAGTIDVHPAPQERSRLTLQRAELPRLLGYSPQDEETCAALAALGLAPRMTDSGFETTVPSWRVDLTREADLVEEIARHLGYERIPVTRSGLPDVKIEPGTADRGEFTRDLLSRAGFHEAYGYAMIARGEDELFVQPETAAATALKHPIVETMAFLRRSIVPGLLRAVDLNHRRGTRNVRLFEVGRVFHPRPDHEFPLEPVRVGLAWSGSGQPQHWSQSAADVDLYDLIGTVEALLENLAPGLAFARQPGGLQGLHPGLSVHWSFDERPLAWAGALHPDRQAAFAHPLWVAEVDLDRLPTVTPTIASYRALPRLGAVERDIAVVLPPGRTWAEIQPPLRAVPAPVPVTIEPVDRYEGPPLEPGSAALTVRVRLQPDRESLTDETIEAYRKALISCLTGPLGLEIRGTEAGG